MKNENKNLKQQVEEKLLNETDPSTPTGSWKRLSSKAKAAITAGAVVLVGGGVGAGIGAGAGLFKGGESKNAIRLIFTKPGIESEEEALVRDELNALQDYFNTSSYLPNLEVNMQSDTDTVDLERLIADGAFDIALSKADDFISDAKLNPATNPLEHEVQYMSVSYRANMYWDPYLNGSSKFANYNVKDRDEKTGRYTYQQKFAEEQAQIVELLNRPMLEANTSTGNIDNGIIGDKRLTFDSTDPNQSTSAETPTSIGGDADQDGQEWTDENSGWYRSEMITSQMGSEKWLSGKNLNFNGVNILDPLSQDANNDGYITRDELTHNVTVSTGQELNTYVNGVFSASQKLTVKAKEDGKTLTKGPLSIGALTNLAEARNIGENENTWRSLFTYKSRTSSSGMLGARQIFEHTFEYDSATNIANGEVTEEDFWVPKDQGEETALALPTRYIKPKESAAQHHYDDLWSTGHSLLSSDFSGWRQQSGNSERWDLAVANGDQSKINDAGSYTDGRVVSVSYPIFNDGWIVRRNISEQNKYDLNVMVNTMLNLPSDDDPNTFLPGDFIARYSHGGYELMDDKVLLEE